LRGDIGWILRYPNCKSIDRRSLSW
jgi:hypothetical protein